MVINLTEDIRVGVVWRRATCWARVRFVKTELCGKVFSLDGADPADGIVIILVRHALLAENDGVLGI